MNQLGDYSPHKIPQHVISILEGIKSKAGDGRIMVVTVKGCGVLGADKSGFRGSHACGKECRCGDCSRRRKPGPEDGVSERRILRPTAKVTTSRALILRACRRTW